MKEFNVENMFYNTMIDNGDFTLYELEIATPSLKGKKIIRS